MSNPGARLRENIAALSILQAMNYVVPLVTVPYLIRTLGPADFGLLSFAQALVIYFDLLTDYGFNLSATRAIASRRDDPEALARTFWRTMFAKIALMVSSAGVLAILVMATPRLRETPLLYACAFLTVIGTVTLPVWFFQGIEQIKFVTVAHSAARLLTIPALIVFVRHPGDSVRAAAIQGCVPLAASILLAPVIWKKVPRRPYLPSLAEVMAPLKDGWHVFVTNTSLVINATTTTVVLGVVAGNTEVGYYSAADKVIRAVSSLLSPVTQALYPHLNGLKARSLDLALRLMRRSFVWIGLLSLAASLATFWLAGPVGRLLFGPGFGRSAGILRCLSPLPFLLALINIIGTQTMLVLEMDALVSRIVFSCAVVNVLLTGALSAWFGALGAAAAAVAIAVLMTLCLASSLRRQGPAVWQPGSEPVCAS